MLIMINMVNAWWNESYDYRYNISCSELDNGLPIVINGTYGVGIGGVKQFIWTSCQGDSTALYFNSNTDYAVGNDTDALPFEVELGNMTSSGDWRSLWDDYGYSKVYHFSNLSDSGENVCHLTAVNAPTRTTSGLVGVGYSLDDGSNQYFTTTCNGILGGATRSHVAFAKISGGGVNLGLVGYGTKGLGLDWSWCVYDSNNDIIHLGVFSGYEDYDEDVVNNSWVMNTIVFTNDGSPVVADAKSYANDYESAFSAQGTPSRVVNTGSTNKFRVGDNHDGSYFDGVIDEVREFNGTLSAGVINMTYQNVLGTSGFGNLAALEGQPVEGGESLIFPANFLIGGVLNINGVWNLFG